MRGTIVLAFKELVERDFSEVTWKEALKQCNLSTEKPISPKQNIKDTILYCIVEKLRELTGLELNKIFDAFGDYWMNVYAPKHYPVFFEYSTYARDFILKVDCIHQILTTQFPRSVPPRFSYTWEDDKTLIIEYHSQRHLIDLIPGLIKGTGRYFDEELEVEKISETKVKVKFKY